MVTTLDLGLRGSVLPEAETLGTCMVPSPRSARAFIGDSGSTDKPSSSATQDSLQSARENRHS